MKKLLAISLLSIYLLSLIGYSLVFQFLINRTDKQFTLNLDAKAYNESDLVEVKTPLNMPYLNTTNKFERADGQIEINGTLYNYVKRKISNDTLYILCLPNFAKTKLCKAKTDYANQSADNPVGKSSDQSALKKISFFSDSNLNAVHFSFDACASSSNANIPFNNLTTLKGFVTKHLQPPDLFI